MSRMEQVFVTDYVRTPIGRYGGALSPVRTDDLAAHPVAALLERNNQVDPEQIGDVVLGSTNQAGEDNRNVARMASLLAGLPDSVPGSTVNRLCGSGMEAVATVAQRIALGEYGLAIAGGVESMSRAPFVIPKAERAFPTQGEIASTTLGWRLVNPRMEEMGHTDSLGVTAENVSSEFSISRADQDHFALRSQMRVAKAHDILAEEIAPVSVPQRRGDPVVVDADEHPRPDSDLESLARLRPAFKEGGSVTAGNSSGINDGAAALLLASEAALSQFSLEPLARVVGSAAVGVAPRIMGMGPVPAVRRLFDRIGWTIADPEVIELNEAFASQALACLREFGLPDDAEHVNPNGGAIALGHPTGMSGARLVGTAAQELQRRDGRRALATMCIGVGQGIAMALEEVGGR